MKVRYIKDAAGVSEGFEKELPNGLAEQLISKGIVEEVKSAPKKQADPEMETKEEKQVSKRRTKSKK
jgi:hypothetical protein